MSFRLSPRLLKFGLNIYGPYLGAGVKVQRISTDWLQMDLAMKLRWYNRNAMKVQFGGSLYSMVDPHFVLLLMQKLGREYVVWDREARIEFLRPGRSEVRAEIRLTEEEVEAIRQQTRDGKACRPEFRVEITDPEGHLIARVHKTLHVRRKPTSDQQRRSK